MDSSMFDEMWKSFFMGVVILLLVAFLLGMTVAWGIPKLWLLIKPILHTWTM